jgi:2-oxoglutarate dehydrogenase E1 component
VLPEGPICDAFRRWGYLEADLDPLGRLKPLQHPELQVQGPDAEAARAVYCGTIGAEFMHCPDPDRRLWVARQIEAPPSELDQAWICEWLAKAEIFEQVLQRRYVGSKRFSIEGVAAAIPLLAAVTESAATHGAGEIVLATAHRGRLNIMVHIVGKDPEEIFAQFEDVDPESVLGGGDVMYHMGANGTYRTGDGRSFGVSLVSNPSHLESVGPVALGRARAKRERIGADGRSSVVPVILHGDAGFAGQGVVAETLNLADLPGYTVGGTIHVIVNNLIGFTTPPGSLHSSRFASDVAKRLPIPILHVNGEDPDAVVRVGRLAVAFRSAFGTDVVIDLIGYRRWGHSEVDDPKLTQPILYATIEKRAPLWRSYAERIGLGEDEMAGMESRIAGEYGAAHDRARSRIDRPALFVLPAHWSPYRGGCYSDSFEVDTGVERDRLERVARTIISTPPGFHVHPKLKKFLELRTRVAAGEIPVDWSTAEALAFGSLLLEGISIRMAGQDTRRGTFNQRHAVLVDVETEEEFCPLANIGDRQGRFGCYDSPLTEFAAVGYEYGYSRDAPEALVVWEAQFGDFANGAQVILDQFVSAGEDKWGLLSGLVLLLPHGHEGQGPEHSSARLERFLQLSAEDNLQVCQPSTSAQYFHLLRRQVMRKWRKPLVVLTPKGWLRRKEVACDLEQFCSGRFRPVIPERTIHDARRILLCTGMIAHALRRERDSRGDVDTAIVTLEQLHPFPEKLLEEELRRHSHAEKIFWVQEEPGNMGAQSFVLPRLRALAGERWISCVRRAASASPATGSRKAHEIEESTLLNLAFGTTGQTFEANRPGRS